MTDDKNKKPAPEKQKGHGPGVGAATEKPKNFGKSMKQILKYSGNYKYAFIVVIFFAIAGTVFQVAGPKVMGRATTVLAEGLMYKIKGTGTIDFAAIGKILALTAFLYALSAIFSFIEGWIMTGITQKIVYKMRRDISEKINRMPMKYFESHQYGDILSRITNDVDTLGTGLNQSITTIITSIATIIGVIVMMLTISPIMTLIAATTIPISIVLLGFIIKMSQKYFKTQQEYLGNINGQIEENFAGQLVIKAFNKEASMEKTFNETNEVLYESAWKSQFISGVMLPVMMFVGNLGYAGVAISGAMLAIKNVIGIGDIQAFIQYVRTLTQPLSQVAQVMNQVQSMGAAGERVFEFLAEEEESPDLENSASQIDVQGFVEFEHVKFGYDPEKVIIKDFSANVKPGQKIAIVGPTGAGKTTIVKLLMRFYDVNAGAIKIDGVDIRSMSRHGLRNNIAMVLQDTWLYSDTIMENIRYGNQNATDEEVIAAAKAARADRFIKTLPGGYDMVLNEDATNISEGQKQLLTIARAILADRKLLILDEATSSVDTRTEVRIQEAMDNLMKGRTTFVIAHRLSTIRDADLILVMNHGDIIEQGTHDELLAQGGTYADLYNSQFDEVEAS
ncbi:ABC transporter ATP-binding protein [Mogibacterium diversum]|uniref:ABC transporter ATP-binding protein n=1 Tax=Mogibacterium diversum TaxID=114527 RepID=UPI0026EC9B0B|nr:ABC transporter ATP-binding protein [Mogibacterium diversum]